MARLRLACVLLTATTLVVTAAAISQRPNSWSESAVVREVRTGVPCEVGWERQFIDDRGSLIYVMFIERRWLPPNTNDDRQAGNLVAAIAALARQPYAEQVVSGTRLRDCRVRANTRVNYILSVESEQGAMLIVGEFPRLTGRLSRCRALVHHVLGSEGAAGSHARWLDHLLFGWRAQTVPAVRREVQIGGASMVVPPGWRRAELYRPADVLAYRDYWLRPSLALTPAQSDPQTSDCLLIQWAVAATDLHNYRFLRGVQATYETRWHATLELLTPGATGAATIRRFTVPHEFLAGSVPRIAENYVIWSLDGDRVALTGLRPERFVSDGGAEQRLLAGLYAQLQSLGPAASER